MFARRKNTEAARAPSMRALEIVVNDGGNGLRIAPYPIPAPGPGELLIKTHYIGINRADIMQVSGLYPPPEGASPLPGLEVSGIIAGMGNKVVGWSIGEEVCALLGGGGYAEYVTVPAGQVLTPPRAVALKEAASLPEAAATAYMALKLEANLKPRERVLVHGGTSGTGMIMAQVARAWGAEVYATAGGREKCEFLRKLGIAPIDHKTGPFHEQLLQATNGEGVDVIIDTLGGPQVANHFKLLRRGGRMVSLAFLQGSTVESLKLGGLLMKNLRWSGATLRSKTAMEKAEIVDGVRKTIWPHVAAGHIRAVVDSVFPLESAEKAHQRMQERLHLGKILLEVAPNAE